MTVDARDGLLAAELARLDRLIARFLTTRERPSSTVPEELRGLVIAPADIDYLLAELSRAHANAADRPIVEPPPPASPLVDAARLFGLSRAERDLLLVAASVDLDLRYGRLFAYINDHASHTRPTIGTALAVCGIGLAEGVECLLTDAPLARFALLGLEGQQPFAEQSLRADPSTWQRLLGLEVPSPFPHVPPTEQALSQLILDEDVRDSARAAARFVKERPADRVLIVVRGQPGSGRDALARAIAAEAGLGTIRVDAESLSRQRAMIDREARWQHAAIVVEGIVNGDTVDRLANLVICIAEDRERLVVSSRREVFETRTSPFDLARRVDLWTDKLGADAGIVGADRLAARFRFGPERIETAVRHARTRAAGERKPLTESLVEEVCRALPDARLGGLAQKLPCLFLREDLVVPPATARELSLATTWVKHGVTVFGAGGPGARLRTSGGLTCLFWGPPGTGKTMAAQVLARELGLDVFRIDLSQVVNKYIGETEKNLARVFDEAAAANAVLFFDEADALFGKRSTDVKDAHDRYANIETGFLLQRMEAHEGVVILATNLRQNLDEAFMRRLHIVAEFPMPGATERLQIWERLLPPRDERDSDVDLGLLAGRFSVAGGYIRNAVITALLYAADEDSPVAMRHLVCALWRELRKAGRALDPDDFGPWRDHILAFAGAPRNGVAPPRHRPASIAIQEAR